MAGRAASLLKGLLIVAIVGAVGYAVYLRVLSEKEEAEGAGAAQASTEARDDAVEGLFRGLDPIPVKATPTVLGTLVQTVHAEGRARPLRQVEVASQVNGQLERILVNEGQFVTSGQVLMELDDEQYQLALEEAQGRLLEAQARYAANVEQTDTVTRSGLNTPMPTISEEELVAAEAEFRRVEAAFQRGEVTLAEFQEAELAFQTARILAGKERGNIQKAEVTRNQIAVQRAQRDLDRTRVRAPFAGRVADIEVDTGQFVGGSTVLCSLLDTARMRVEVDVLESEIAPIRAGRDAEIQFTALGEELFTARVLSVNPIIDPQTRTGKVTLDLQNPEGRVTPGMFARARIFARDIEDVLMVPLEAIVERDERTLVFAVEESASEDEPDIVKWRYVQLGERNDTHVIVLPTDNPHEGVSEGMLVCVEGHVSLQHDSPVRLVETVPSDVLRP